MWKMTKIQEIENIFSIFHDGYVDDFNIQGSQVDLKIGIQYLAELIDDKYEFLNLSLIGVQSISYDAWSDPTFLMTDWDEVLKLGVEILNTETDRFGRIIIHSYCDSAPNDSFEGGKLIIKCSDYKLFDEANNNLTFDELKELSSEYWNRK